MFTGIIEAVGNIENVMEEGSNYRFWISSAISDLLKIDQSVAHDGVCLTVDAIMPGRHRVTAVAQTLSITALSRWKMGKAINLETCMQLNGKLDGHIVQGHVDSIATCLKKEDKDGSWLFKFEFPFEFTNNIVEKGSICINGTSLTIFDIGDYSFHVAIIPYTYEHTNFRNLEPGDPVNVEFDILGKYINRMMENKAK